MVVANRVAYLKRLLVSDTKLVATASANSITLNEKIRIHVYPQTHIAAMHQSFVAHILDMLLLAVDTHPVADRGHKHSDGHSEVSFVISRGSSRSALCPGAGLPTVSTDPVTSRVDIAGSWAPLQLQHSEPARPSALQVGVAPRLPAQASSSSALPASPRPVIRSQPVQVAVGDRVLIGKGQHRNRRGVVNVVSSAGLAITLEDGQFVPCIRAGLAIVLDDGRFAPTGPRSHVGAVTD